MRLGHDDTDIGDKLEILGAEYKLGDHIEITFNNYLGLFKDIVKASGYLMGREPANKVELKPDFPDRLVIILDHHDPSVPRTSGGKGGPKRTRGIYEKNITSVVVLEEEVLKSNS
jgi:hypothetical protein